MTLNVYNLDGSVRWNLIIKQHPEGYKVEDSDKHSLFNSDNWKAGNTPGAALDAFLTVEESLLNSLI